MIVLEQRRGKATERSVRSIFRNTLGDLALLSLYPHPDFPEHSWLTPSASIPAEGERVDSYGWCDQSTDGITPAMSEGQVVVFRGRTEKIEGVVTKVDFPACIDADPHFDFSGTPIGHGMSGGPVIGASRNVIGLNSKGNDFGGIAGSTASLLFPILSVQVSGILGLSDSEKLPLAELATQGQLPFHDHERVVCSYLDDGAPTIHYRL